MKKIIAKIKIKKKKPTCRLYRPRFTVKTNAIRSAPRTSSVSFSNGSASKSAKTRFLPDTRVFYVWKLNLPSESVSVTSDV